MAGASGAALPRSLTLFGIPVSGLLLVTLFIYLGFPYDRLGEYVEAEVQRRIGVTLSIQAIEPSLSFSGPGFASTGLSARWPGSEPLVLDSARIHPAWSLSWLRGSPLIRARLSGPLGQIDGTVPLNGSGSWVGTLSNVKLAVLPLEQLLPGVELEGLADATVDLALGETGPEGTLFFRARDGTVLVPGIPMALPYEELSGDLEFGGASLISVNSIDLKGPLITAQVIGSVGHAPSFEAAPLALTVILQSGRGLRSLLKTAGIRASRGETTRIRITGTVGNPTVR